MNGVCNRVIAVLGAVYLAVACQFPSYAFAPEPSNAGAGGSGGQAGAPPSAGGAPVGEAGAPAGGEGGEDSGPTGGVGPGGQGGEGGGGQAGESGEAGAGGVPSGPCSGSELFCDDFEDEVANGWTPSGGVWAVVEDGSQNHVYRGGQGSEESIAGESTWTAQVVEARLRSIVMGATDSYRIGIMARYESSSSFYAFALGGDGKLTLRRSTGAPSGAVGTCAPVTAGIDPNKWFTLKLEVTGPLNNVHLKTYLNGTLIHDCVTTTTTVASGSAGVLTVGSGTIAEFDDLRVVAP